MPQGISRTRRFFLRVYGIMKAREFKFALKTATLTSLLTIIILIPASQTFDHWYWTLITIIAVMQPAFGLSYIIGIYRIIGTIIGAAWGLVVWYLSFQYEMHLSSKCTGIHMLPSFYYPSLESLLRMHLKRRNIPE